MTVMLWKQTHGPLYIAGYLVMAAGLFWPRHFFIFNDKKSGKKMARAK